MDDDDFIPGKSIMGETRKSAYRSLVRGAIVDVRDLCCDLNPLSWNPLKWRHHYVRSRDGGAIADWLHSFVGDIVGDFAHFNEELFWSEHDRFAAGHPEMAECDFRSRFTGYFPRSEESAPLLLFSVGAAFIVNGQGLVLVPQTWGLASASKGAEVEIRLLDSSVIKTTVLGTLFRPKPAIIIAPIGYPVESFVDAKIYVLTPMPSR